MKNYVALARVSSREQEREGFSLDVQEDALKKYALRNEGEITKFFRIAETASKRDERKSFKELLRYAKDNAKKIDGLLFYKIDRAARNLFDYVELERLEEEYEIPCIYVSQPTENTPAGKLQRRILANMATFYTEQQSIDVKEGMARRVESGLFSGKAPYGYQNIRVDGKSIVQIHSENGDKVKRIFDLYAHTIHTVDGVSEILQQEGIIWSAMREKFTRSKLHTILRDRSYIGEVKYNGDWHTGSHQPLIDRQTFKRVQVLLGDKHYNAHTSVYGSGMIECSICGQPIVAEIKVKQTKTGEKTYYYYRCAKYTAKGHPRGRATEKEFNAVVMDMFKSIKVEDPKVTKWIVNVLRAKTKDRQLVDTKKLSDLTKQVNQLKAQRDRLLNLRILDEIEADTFAKKDAELRDRQANLSLEIDGCNKQQSEKAENALKVFELSQSLMNKWLSADIIEKRQILEILCLNFSFDAVSLSYQMRKPFQILSEKAFVISGRGDRI